MTAIKAHKDKIADIDKAIEGCLQDGCVKDCFRYKYQLLYRERQALQESLDWMLGSTLYKKQQERGVYG